MGWMGDIFDDYLKFKGITPLGVLLYPILAPTLLIIALVVHIAWWWDDFKAKVRR